MRSGIASALSHSAICTLVLLSTTVAQQTTRLAEVPIKDHLPQAGVLTRALAFADVDGDGDNDLLVAQDELRIWRNDGQGSYVDSGTFGPSSAQSFDVQVFDSDGDGDVDVLTCSADEVRYFLNDGSGQFGDVTQGLFGAVLQITPCGGTRIAIADVDGDGDPDVVTQGPRLFLNDGLGRFFEAAASNLPVDPLFRDPAPVLADFDGDGDTDLALVPAAGRSARLYVNNGVGAFTRSGATLPTQLQSGEVTRSFAVDIDSDGDLDLINAIDATRWATTIWVNDGSGNFTDESASRILMGDGGALARPVDLNADGHVDLVVGPESRLLFNNGAGAFSNLSIGRLNFSATGATAVAAGDCDGDGDQDLVFGQSRLERDALLLNDGVASFTDATRSRVGTLELGSVGSIARGDINGDGLPDLVLGSRFSVFADASDRVLINTGGLTFIDRTQALLPNLPERTASVALAELQGPGRLDLVRGMGDGRVILHPSDGVGSFGAAQTLLAASGIDAYVVAQDLDGDGRVDLLVSRFADLRLLMNRPGGFVDESAARLPGVIGTQSLVGDFDGDGDHDIVVISRGANELLINDGSGLFASAVSFAPVAEMALDAAAGDFDGDGDADLYFANVDQDTLYLNDGSANFVLAANALPAEQSLNGAIEVVDMDSDGDLDVVTGIFTPGGRTLRVLANDGSGVFRTESGLWWDEDGLFGVLALVADDFDGDGDSDLVISEQARIRVLANSRQPQIFAPLVPRLGFDYRLRVTPFEPFAVVATSFFFAPRFAGVPVATPFGNLALDPASLVTVASTFSHSVSLTLPSDPSFVGFEMRWQAASALLDGSRIALSDAIVDPIVR